MSDSRTPEITAERRLFIGLAVQPFVTALLGLALFAVVDYTGRPLYGGRPVDSFDRPSGSLWASASPDSWSRSWARVRCLCGC
jgi:hypothetical protein